MPVTFFGLYCCFLKFIRLARQSLMKRCQVPIPRIFCDFPPRPTGQVWASEIAVFQHHNELDPWPGLWGEWFVPNPAFLRRAFILNPISMIYLFLRYFHKRISQEWERGLIAKRNLFISRIIEWLYPCKNTAFQCCFRDRPIIPRINGIRRIIPLQPNMSLWYLYKWAAECVCTYNIPSLPLFRYCGRNTFPTIRLQTGWFSYGCRPCTISPTLYPLWDKWVHFSTTIKSPDWLIVGSIDGPKHGPIS